jgi:hypothetical protein
VDHKNLPPALTGLNLTQIKASCFYRSANADIKALFSSKSKANASAGGGEGCESSCKGKTTHIVPFEWAGRWGCGREGEGDRSMCGFGCCSRCAEGWLGKGGKWRVADANLSPPLYFPTFFFGFPRGLRPSPTRGVPPTHPHPHPTPLPHVCTCR